MTSMEKHRLFEMAIELVATINSRPRDVKLRAFLLDPAEMLQQKSSRDLMLKVQQKLLFLDLDETPSEGICQFLHCSLKKDLRVFLPVSDISNVWEVPEHKLDLKNRDLESKIFSTGRAYLWESLIDCYGDQPGMGNQ